MRFKVSSKLEYSVNTAGTILLNIQPATTSAQCVLEESLTVEPAIATEEFVSEFSRNRYLRLDISTKTDIKISYSAVVETKHQVFSYEELDDVPLAEMDLNQLAYVNPSRYCQSDKFYRFAEKNFGQIENGYLKVLEICNRIYNTIDYLPGSTNSQTSAFETLTESAGVCRDFAHLGIALCRASAIPARYFTGYAYQLNPSDFHACFEAYLGKHWIVFDPTRLAPVNGLVKISNSKDAADAALASIFGDVNSGYISVSCDIIDDSFTPLHYSEQNRVGIAFE